MEKTGIGRPVKMGQDIAYGKNPPPSNGKCGIETYCYRKNRFFRDDFPFAILKLSNRSRDFNLTKRFQRQFWKIAYIVRGSGNYIIGEQKLPFQERSIIVTHPDAETTWDIHGEELQLFNLVFDRSFLGFDMESGSDRYHFLNIFSARYTQECESPMFLLTADREINALIRRLFREFEDCLPHREELIRLEFQELLWRIMRRIETRNHRNPAWTAQYLLSYIRNHFSEEISLDELAHTVGLSKERLCRLFREQTGNSIMQQLKAIRLAEAKRLLKSTALPVFKIMNRTGFRSLPYFDRCFTAACGVPPETYRNLHKIDK